MHYGHGSAVSQKEHKRPKGLRIVEFADGVDGHQLLRNDRSRMSLPHRPFHLQLDQPVHLFGGFHRKLLHRGIA
jgi:hypothetical protein